MEGRGGHLYLACVRLERAKTNRMDLLKVVSAPHRKAIYGVSCLWAMTERRDYESHARVVRLGV